MSATDSPPNQTTGPMLTKSGGATWKAWSARFREFAATHEAGVNTYGPDPMAACGEVCWREMYDDDWCPEDALTEDLQNGE